MGTSEGSDGGMGMEDWSVGTIVWVRRRNGSWWPGRILGPQEMSASHLMSPRSGTPVKLLGREDASVDWYNLEKSKRVKPFRCGEFDACIERAEASQRIAIKKREKYARREDAILHALDLEKQQLEMKQLQAGIISNGRCNISSGFLKRDSHNSSSELYMRNDNAKKHGKSANHKSQILCRKMALPFSQKTMGDSFDVHDFKSGKQFSLEDVPEATRTQGLQDIGLRITPSQTFFQAYRNPIDNNVEILSSTGSMTERVGNVGGSKNNFSIKKKRSHGGMVEESLMKRCDRRRPLVQVLQSSVKLADPHSFQPDNATLGAMLGETEDSGIDMCQIKRSRCDSLPSDSSDSFDHLGYYLEQKPFSESQLEMDSSEEFTSSESIGSSDSDSSETGYLEPYPEDDANPSSGSDHKQMPGDSIRQVSSDPSGNQVSEQAGHMNEERQISGYTSHLHPGGPAHALNDIGASKWHLKGKRNIRHTGKRHMDAVDRNFLFSSLSRGDASYKSKGDHSNMRSDSSSFRALDQGVYRKREEVCSGYDEVDMFDSALGHDRFVGYGNQRHPLDLKAVRARSQSFLNDSKNDSHAILPLSWEANDAYCMPQMAYWDDLDEHFESVYADYRNDDLDPLLIDVDLKVQAASYHGEHVPLVSLMSKLNGKAIVGHPVQIEILEDGFTALLLRGDAVLDDGTRLPPVWKTARRTAMQRVPRTNPGTTTLAGDAPESHSCPVVESRQVPIKAFSVHFGHQAKSSTKSTSQSRSASGKLQQKLSKKVISFSKKTRTLSSIATQHKLSGKSGDANRLRSNDLLSGLMKPEDAVPLVTCVPLKVVFSRIMEAVGRPSSFSVHRVRMTSSAVRNQSER